MPAQAGIQGREGMDTGFRRYDETCVLIRRPVHTCTCIFKGDAEHTEFGIILNYKLFPLRRRGEISDCYFNNKP